jgi:hypothetical protein
MTPVSYTVTATIPNKDLAERYVAWLMGTSREEGHVRAVQRAGAHEAQVIALFEPAEAIRIQTRYLFETRAAFDQYIARHAPALRASGLALFGPETGITFERTVGDLLWCSDES